MIPLKSLSEGDKELLKRVVDLSLDEISNVEDAIRIVVKGKDYARKRHLWCILPGLAKEVILKGASARDVRNQGKRDREMDDLHTRLADEEFKRRYLLSAWTHERNLLAGIPESDR